MRIRNLAQRPRAMASLWAGYLASTKPRSRREITDTTFARFLDPAEPMFALVAEENDAADRHRPLRDPSRHLGAAAISAISKISSSRPSARQRRRARA